MVSVYTTSGRFTKQGVDDNPNTWGTILNSQVIDLFEEAVFGVIDVDLTGSSNVTLTTANGSTDQARHAVIELTGTIGADIELRLPAIEKIYMLRCDWVGDYIVTAKIEASGTSVPLTTGLKKIVYINGVDIYDMVDLSDAMLKSSNLSDVVDVAASRTNLGLGDFAEKTVGTGFTDAAGVISVPSVADVGDLKMTAVSSAPSGWLLCNGAAVSRTTYADLFAAIGVTYGEGDGGTTFNVPNSLGRSPLGLGQGDTGEGATLGTDRALGELIGTETHTLASGEMEHTHETGASQRSSSNNNRQIKDSAWPFGLGGTTYAAWNQGFGGFDESSSQSRLAGPVRDDNGTPTDHENMQPSFVVNFIIYAGV